MYSQFDHYSLENKVRSHQSAFIAEAAHQRMVDEVKQTRQSKWANYRTPRHLVGETFLKIGSWLTHTPQLKEI